MAEGVRMQSAQPVARQVQRAQARDAPEQVRGEALQLVSEQVELSFCSEMTVMLVNWIISMVVFSGRPSEGYAVRGTSLQTTSVFPG